MTIPRELTERDQWVLWRIEERKARNGEVKPTKVPYRAADPRRKASVTDPASWASYAQALAAVGEHESIDGIGYVFAADDPLCGIDLDACVDPQTGELHPAAAEIVAAMASYTEPSPSRTGVHVIVAAVLNGTRHRTGQTPWDGVFEVYDRERFFTVTGDGTGEIARCQAQVDALVGRMFASASSNGHRPVPLPIGADLPAAVEPAQARTAEQLIAQFPKLGRIVRREIKAPKDSTASGWDNYLTCEGCRLGLTDRELEAMIAYARRGDPKGLRRDYLAQTIGHARAETAGEQSTRGGSGQADAATRISERWNIAEDPIVSGKPIGDVASGAAIVHLRRDSGRVLRLPKLGDLFDPRRHTRIVSQGAKSRFAPLTNAQAVEIAQLIIDLCPGEDADPLEEARQWITDFVERLAGVVDADLDRDEWAAFAERDDLQRKAWSVGRSVAIRDQLGDLWLPAWPLRKSIDDRMEWAVLRARLEEIDWRHEDIDMWQKGIPRKQARHIHTIFYVGREPDA